MIVVSVFVSDPCDDGILHAGRERNILSKANTPGIFVPGMNDNLFEVVLWDFGKQLLDCRTNLVRGLLVALHSVMIVSQTLPCKSLHDDIVALLLRQIGNCDVGIFVGDIAQGFASFFDNLAAKVIPNAMRVV